MKKNLKDFEALEKEYYENVKAKNLSYKLCDYVWRKLICMSKGYGFNASHTLAYSIVGMQEANLAYNFPIEYWNCANLISDSGGENDTVNYGKIASALSRMKKEGIKITLPNINEASFDFSPKSDKHEIMFGFKPISGIGASVAKQIEETEDCTSALNFYNKMQTLKSTKEGFKFGDQAMISLIKAGCFDEIENRPREEIMRDFIYKISPTLKQVNLQNIEELYALGLLSPEEKKRELRFYRFKNYIFNKNNITEKTGKSPSTFYYQLDTKFAEPFFLENFEHLMTEGKDYYYDNGHVHVKRGSFEKVYDSLMETFKSKIQEDPIYLEKINQNRAQQLYLEYCSGSISKWEMDSLSYYYHDHELAHVNKRLYGIENFDNLPENPEVVATYHYKDRDMNRYNITRICGTVIDRDKKHNMVTILSLDGVVQVKLNKNTFMNCDRDIIIQDGSNKITEDGWFSRGTKLIFAGYRNGEQFVCKTYKDSIYKYPVQYVADIFSDGKLLLRSSRLDEENVVY